MDVLELEIHISNQNPVNTQAAAGWIISKNPYAYLPYLIIIVKKLIRIF